MGNVSCLTSAFMNASSEGLMAEKGHYSEIWWGKVKAFLNLDSYLKVGCFQWNHFLSVSKMLESYNSYFVWSGLQRTRRAIPRGCQSAVIKDRSTYILFCPSTTPLSVIGVGVNIEQRQVGDSRRIPTPFFCPRFFFLCIIRLAPAQPKQGPWSNSNYPLHKSHNNNGWRGFSCRGVLLPSAGKFHMHNAFWQRHAHVPRLVTVTG